MWEPRRLYEYLDYMWMWAAYFKTVFLYSKLKTIIISKTSSFLFSLVKHLEVPGMANSGCAVNMTLSSLGIKLTSIENGRIVANHDMQGISFASGGEKVFDGQV